MRRAPALRQQRGVALILAVLIVAVVATVATTMASRQQVDIRRSANLLDADLAYMAALGGEDWIRGLLKKDDRNNDNLNEDWAQLSGGVIEWEGAVLTGAITDLTGRFNLNNLLTETGDVSQPDLEQFQRLLQVLTLDPSIANAILDWLDANIDPLSGGAEDDYYMSKTPGYRAANSPLLSPSELRLIKDINDETYKLLAPHVSTLPQRSKLNVNTASAEVLASLVAGFTNSEGQTLVDNRPEDGHTSVADFLAQPQLANMQIDEARLAINSEYFLANANAEFGRGRIQLYSVLSRDNQGVVATIMRTQGAY